MKKLKKGHNANGIPFRIVQKDEVKSRRKIHHEFQTGIDVRN